MERYGDCLSLFISNMKGLMMQEYFTVSELNDYINSLLTADVVLYDFWLKGEISGFKTYQQSGHMYFTLKDRESVISSVMFKSRAQKLSFTPKDGVEVLARGSISVFSKQGKYQFYVQEMHIFGVGDLHWQLEQLKKKLQEKGFFAADSKKAIPAIVKRLGIVSSQDGAALRDILKVLRHRAGNLEIVLAHSSVQGAEAPAEVAEGIRGLNELGDIQVIIVARGGGSFEDLMAFNSETVVEAIYHSKIPVITGIGHEVDTTLADLAADVRAATPTQAAQIAVPDNAKILDDVFKYQERLTKAVNKKILNRSEELDRIMMRKVWQQPEIIFKEKQLLLNDSDKRLKLIIKNRYQEKSVQFTYLITKLDSLSPLKVMQRGYALIQKDDKILRNTDHVQIGDIVAIQLWQNRLLAEIVGKEKTDDGN